MNGFLANSEFYNCPNTALEEGFLGNVMTSLYGCRERPDPVAERSCSWTRKMKEQKKRLPGAIRQFRNGTAEGCSKDSPR